MNEVENPSDRKVAPRMPFLYPWVGFAIRGAILITAIRKAIQAT